jgi:hypothetical protein
MATVTLDERGIIAKVLKSEAFQREAYKRLADKVERAKEELVQEFNESPVTQEIEAGPDVEHSRVLPEGYGNLFSFLGFEDGSDPVSPVREQLERIGVNKKPQVTANKWVFTIRVPSADDLEKASPMQWETGRSWINAITKGLTGFSYYLSTLKRRVGRSGTGVQTENVIRPGTYFAGTSYIIGMLGKFKRKFTR